MSRLSRTHHFPRWLATLLIIVFVVAEAFCIYLFILNRRLTRELVSHAADLAVGVAAERIRKSITDDDQKRLADRYVQQLKGAGGGQS